MSIDPKDLPLQGTELQANPSEPMPMLRVAEPIAANEGKSVKLALSPLRKRLSVLLRCHEAAGWFRVWQWVWWGIRALVVIGVTIPLCIGIGIATFRYALESPTWSNQAFNAHHAMVTGWVAGLGTAAGILLLWTIFEWFMKRRYAPLEEQIAAIQREHAGDIATWGSPAILRDPGAVAEILRLESGGR